MAAEQGKAQINNKIVREVEEPGFPSPALDAGAREFKSHLPDQKNRKHTMTNLQSEQFYKEANDMQPGWGDYLKRIDELKNKFDACSQLTIDEACWILWAEKYVPSQSYLAFKQWVKENDLHTHMLTFNIWHGMYEGFMKDYK